MGNNREIFMKIKNKNWKEIAEAFKSHDFVNRIPNWKIKIDSLEYFISIYLAFQHSTTKVKYFIT